MVPHGTAAILFVFVAKNTAFIEVDFFIDPDFQEIMERERVEEIYRLLRSILSIAELYRGMMR